jgi:hypothetical protein
MFFGALAVQDVFGLIADFGRNAFTIDSLVSM